jgi:integrase
MAKVFVRDGNKLNPWRRGRWIVDYHNPDGDRKWKTFKSQQAAEDYRDQLEQQLKGFEIDDDLDFDITVADYAERRWLPEVKAVKKFRTWESYRDAVKVHLKPAFGKIRVRDLTRRRITRFLVSKVSAGLKHSTVRVIYATLRRMLSVAVRDGLLLANPASKLGKEFSLVPSSRQRQEAVKAMTGEQLATFLHATNKEWPAYVPLFATLACAGLRLGEGLGLQWADLNFGEVKSQRRWIIRLARHSIAT